MTYINDSRLRELYTIKKAQKEVEELHRKITDILMVLDKEKDYLIGEAQG